MSDSDDLDLGKKRLRKETPEILDDDNFDDKKNRGNYRCSKCNLPKKGHVCPFQPRYRRRDQMIEEAVDVEIQVELDADMTVRKLVLEEQGLPVSYLSVQESKESKDSKGGSFANEADGLEPSDPGDTF